MFGKVAGQEDEVTKLPCIICVMNSLSCMLFPSIGICHICLVNKKIDILVRSTKPSFGTKDHTCNFRIQRYRHIQSFYEFAKHLYKLLKTILRVYMGVISLCAQTPRQTETTDLFS